MTLQIDQITPGLGAEIRGVNLAQPLLPDQIEQIKQAFLDHMVLVFRDQDLSREQHN